MSAAPLSRGLADDACVALPAALVYWLTLAPTVTTGDSGELITAAATLSLAHPTGYPLYLLSGWAFAQLAQLLSLGTVAPAFALNLFSALAASAACVVLRRVVEVLVGDRLVATSTALLFAFSASLWSQATTARVYALGALLLALVLLELARLQERRGGSLARAWLYFGLGMANHTVMMVVLPLLALASLQLPSWWARAKSACLALPGLSLYAYVPIAASFDPVQSWGDPSVAERLIPYLSRESFWSKRYVDELGDLWSVAASDLDRIPVELGWIGTALLVAGIATARHRRWLVWSGLYLFASSALLVALHGSRQDIFHWHRYLIPGWIGLVLVTAAGLESVLREIRAASWLAPRRAAELLAAGLGPLFLLVTGFAAADRSSDTWAHDFGAAILEGLEPGALLFAEEDNVLFPLSYLHHVEGLRPDVELVMQGINLRDSMAIEPDRRPTYFTHPRDLGSGLLALLPDGLVLRLSPAGDGFRGRPFAAVALPSFEAVREPGSLRYLDRSLVGNYYFMQALSREAEDPAAAMRAVETLRRVSFDNAVNQVNAGLLLERNLRFEAALEAFETASALDPANELAVTRSLFWRDTLDRAASVPDPRQRQRLVADALVRLGRLELAARLLGVPAPRP